MRDDFYVLVIRLLEFLHQHGQLIFIGDGAHVHACFVTECKRRGMIVNGDFLVAIRFFLRHEPPKLSVTGTGWENAELVVNQKTASAPAKIWQVCLMF